jgi:hypothetical protein
MLLAARAKRSFGHLNARADFSQVERLVGMELQELYETPHNHFVSARPVVLFDCVCSEAPNH